jgi:hypothetical protein
MTTPATNQDEAATLATHQAGLKAVNNFKVGDVFKGAFGHAQDIGITDKTLSLRSAFTQAFLDRWQERKGAAGGLWDAPVVVLAIT